VSTALTAFGNYLDSILPFGKIIMTVLNGIVSLALISFLFAAIYKVLRDRSLEWRDVVVGAIVTAVLFTIGKLLISCTLEAVQCFELRSRGGADRPSPVGLLFGSDIFAWGRVH
jgi:membrane protein